MSESLQSRLTRWKFNLFPAYRRTGARITYIAADFSEVRIRLPLNWKTRNVVGTVFGGAMYAAVDPIYMVMLMRLLGPGYIVWDKAAAIRFRRPGQDTLYGCFSIAPEEVDLIRGHLQTHSKLDRVYPAELVDAAGKVHATFEKTLHIRRRPDDRKDAPAP